jgi:hypothetical protein
MPKFALKLSLLVLTLFLGRSFSIVANIKFLALAFSACSFCWVRRDTNGVAHALAKYALSQPHVFLILDQISLPLCLRLGLEICLFCLLNRIVPFSKKDEEVTGVFGGGIRWLLLGQIMGS